EFPSRRGTRLRLEPRKEMTVLPIRWLSVSLGLTLATPGLLLAQVPDHTGPVPRPVPLGELVQTSPHILVLRVDEVDRDERMITYRKVADLKGGAAEGKLRHAFHDDATPAILAWARPGRVALCFGPLGWDVTCLGNFWYYSWGSDGKAGRPLNCADWADGF